MPHPQRDAAAAQGLAEAAGSGAAAVGAFTAAPLFDALGAGPAWLIAGITMAVLLTVSSLLDRPRRRAPLGRPADVEPAAVSRRLPKGSQSVDPRLCASPRGARAMHRGAGASESAVATPQS